jgi:hypothetical protein
VTKAKKHGGARKGAGRKPSKNPRSVKVTSTYTTEEAEALAAVKPGKPRAVAQREVVLERIRDDKGEP